MQSKLLTLLSAVILFGCNSLKEQLAGGWVVDQAYYHDEPVRWGFYSNGISLNDDQTCQLPIDNWDDRHSSREKGTWDAFRKNGNFYIKINSENEVLNNTFLIQDLRKIKDPVSLGYLLKMSLSVDSLRMDCTKALYE